MKHHARFSRSGFTLTEMAIVLAVVGVLVAGLWNLLSGASTQARDQAAANQQSQLITAVKGYLATTQGQTYMKTNTAGGCGGGNCAASASMSLPLPANNSSVANCTAWYLANYAADAGNLSTFCSYLPPGLTSGNVTPYGEAYSIRILRDSTLAGSPPASYSFMIVTTAAGTVIPDSSGARISSLIGGDGGFVYATPACTAAVSTTTACGSFGGWSASVTGASPGYGFAAANYTGSVASRTFVSPQQNNQSMWLARLAVSGDSNYTLNSMTTPEYLGNNALVMGTYTAGATPDNSSKSIYMGNFDSVALPTSGGGAINMQGGTFNFVTPGAASGGGTMNMQGGTVNMGGGVITGTGASRISMVNPSGSPASNSPITVGSGCNKTSPSDNSCVAAVQITNGDVTVANLLAANALYATTFIYQSSDMRLKTDVHPLSDPLTDVMRLKPVTFTFKSNGKKGIGVIAQDLEHVYPELVSNGEYKSVNYEGLIGPLIGAVQELKHENDNLRQQLREQAVRQEKLERLLEKRAP